METTRGMGMKLKAIAIVSLAALAAAAETVNVADCVRSADLDVWAAADAKFCRIVMDEVFKSAGLEVKRSAFGADNRIVVSNAEVVCSAFRTEAMLKDYAFPLQPLGRLHIALYATPDRAMAMTSTRISDWPRMRVGYSSVSQGDTKDRQEYFENARLSPEYVNYPTSAGAEKALRDGEIDALFLYTPFGKRPKGLVEVVPIGARNAYFAVRKDRPELMQRLTKAYRDYYIDHIDRIDALRSEMLGIPKPVKRVRVAAYMRGDLFNVTPDGDRSGSLETWMKSLCSVTRWTPDFVYGGYDESIADVHDGRLDMIGGLGFDASRRTEFLFPHTPIGMLRVYLWTHPEKTQYKVGEPSTWKGMRIGMLSGAISSQRAKRQFGQDSIDVEFHEYATDGEMVKAYFEDKIDACIDVEMPRLSNEVALHLYTSHPMYICTTTKRPDLFNELEKALEEVCDDFPKYMRMISERHYGVRRDMVPLSFEEEEWLAKRRKNPAPVMVDFSPWPFKIRTGKGEAAGLAELLQAEIKRKTGLVIVPQEQTGLLTAQAKFMRGETSLWIPYPEKPPKSTYGTTSVFSLPVPQSVGDFYGAAESDLEFEMFASSGTPHELVSILRKAVTSIDHVQLQEMFMDAAAERKVVHRLFGLTREELVKVVLVVVLVVLLGIAAYGFGMNRMLRREAARANEAAAKAEEHAQAKTRFLAMMSHELRTPLNAVIGFAEFLSREGIDERHRKDYTDGILLSSNALLDLINDLLDLSKLDAGAMDIRSGTCDILQLMRELPAIFGYRVRRHGVKLNIVGPAPGGIPVLAFSQQAMRQIMLNLVGNAAKFTEEGEIRVEIEWDAEPHTLKITVSDTGCGISEAKMERLFDPFVQDIASRMNASGGEMKGTGLGLPIVKRMVDAAHGTVKAESTLGKGTSFEIVIPDLAIAEGVSSAARSAESTIRAAMPDRVLVVDDMTMNRKILGIHLGNLKVKDIRYAENGEDALEVMKEWVPDLVLTDMWMPKMDGSQLAEAMRKDRRLAEIPIVAVTADVDVGSSYDLSLFAKVIAKPVTTDKLRALFGDIGTEE